MITMSDRANTELKRIISEQEEPDLAIRIFVSGACGCGAAHYGMGVENDFAEADSVFESEGVKLVVDNESAPYLEGAEIDFKDGLMGRGFTIQNPSKAGSGGGGCGCGH
jgi:iron-sulfur cluster assembly accessory protein